MNDVIRHRLASHGLGERVPDGAREVVRHMCAVQAQDYRAALWAIGIRSPGLSRGAVEEAVRSRQIVRAWPLRGTIHFVAASDLHWILSLTRDRIIRASAGRYRELKLDDEVFSRAADALLDAFRNTGELTRARAREVLARAGLNPAGQRAYHIIRHLALQGEISLGPEAKSGPTIIAADPPPADSDSRGASVVRLVRRYLSARAPATAADVAWWSGLPLREIREAIALLADEVVQREVDGTAYFQPIDQSSLPVPAADAHLLPAFDEYLIGYRDRSAALRSEHSGGLVSSNGIFRPVVLVAGRVEGTWRQSSAGNETLVELALFRKLARTEEKALQQAAHRYGRFLGSAVRLTRRTIA